MAERPELKPIAKEEGSNSPSFDGVNTTDRSREASSSSLYGSEVKQETESKPELTIPAATPGKGRKKGAQPVPVKPVFIDDLPTATTEALETFESLERCLYEFKNLGMSMEQDEMMVCDCVYDRGEHIFLPCLFAQLLVASNEAASMDVAPREPIIAVGECSDT